MPDEMVSEAAAEPVAEQSSEPSAEIPQVSEAQSQYVSDIEKVLLTDAIRSDPNMKGLRTVEDVAKRMISAQKMIGAKRFEVPDETAPAEK